MALIFHTDLPRNLAKIMGLLTAIMDKIDEVARYVGFRKIPEPEVVCSDLEPDSALQSIIQELQKSLPAMRFRDADLGVNLEQECPVCLNCMQDEDMVRRMPHCRHTFHRDCMDSWLRHSHATCPLCRSSLLSEQLQCTLKDMVDDGELEEWVLSSLSHTFSN